MVSGYYRIYAEPYVRKEWMLEKTQEVIKKHMETVQQVACFAGEKCRFHGCNVTLRNGGLQEKMIETTLISFVLRNNGNFIEVDFFQKNKAGNVVCGDCFMSQKLKGEGRVISVLSDGLEAGSKPVSYPR